LEFLIDSDYLLGNFIDLFAIIYLRLMNNFEIIFDRYWQHVALIAGFYSPVNQLIDLNHHPIEITIILSLFTSSTGAFATEPPLSFCKQNSPNGKGARFHGEEAD